MLLSLGRGCRRCQGVEWEAAQACLADWLREMNRRPTPYSAAVAAATAVAADAAEHARVCHWGAVAAAAVEHARVRIWVLQEKLGARGLGVQGCMWPNDFGLARRQLLIFAKLGVAAARCGTVLLRGAHQMHAFVLVLTLFIFKAPNYVLARTLTERVV